MLKIPIGGWTVGEVDEKLSYHLHSDRNLRVCWGEWKTTSGQFLLKVVNLPLLFTLLIEYEQSTCRTID